MWATLALLGAAAAFLLLAKRQSGASTTASGKQSLPTYRSEKLWWLPDLISHSYELLFTRTERKMNAIYDRLGSAFVMTTVMGRSMLLSGPKLAHWAFTGERKVHEMVPAPHWLDLMGKLSLAGVHGEEHRRLRKCLTSAFTASALAEYHDSIAVATKEFLDDLVTRTAKQGPPLDIYMLTKNFTMDIALRIIFSADTRTDPRLANMLTDFVEWFEGLATVVPVNVPFSSLRRALNARARILHTIGLFYSERVAELQEQSASADDGRKDMLQQLVLMRDDNDQPLAKEQLCDIILGFLFAGHDSTMGLLCSTLYAVDRAMPTECLEKLRAEVNGAFPAPEQHLFDHTTISRLPYLDACCKELLRVYGPIMGLTRTIIAETEMPVTSSDGHEYQYRPAIGSQFTVDLKHATHSECYYANPHAFDPERFIAPREEDKKAPHTFIPFGGGARMCIGAPLVRQELKIFLATLVHGDGYRVQVDSFKEHSFPVTHIQPTLRVFAGCA